jgi:hypothetical protein
MDHLPLTDIPMLVSSINFLLRDEEFDNLDQIRSRASVRILPPEGAGIITF